MDESSIFVFSARRFAQGPGADVRRQDGPVPSVGNWEVLGQVHGDAVGFLARGAGGGPDFESRRAGAARGGNGLGDQEFEVVFFSEEMGEVGGQGVHHLGHFGLVGVGSEELAIGLEVGEPVKAHSLAQTGFDELALSIVQPDA